MADILAKETAAKNTLLEERAAKQEVDALRNRTALQHQVYLRESLQYAVYHEVYRKSAASKNSAIGVLIWVAIGILLCILGFATMQGGLIALFFIYAALVIIIPAATAGKRREKKERENEKRREFFAQYQKELGKLDQGDMILRDYYLYI